MTKKLTTEEFIEKAIKVHGNKYNYDKVIYINCKEKIIITCTGHSDFEQTPSEHLQGYGCKKCAGNYKPTIKEFIEKANIIHNNKYNYDKAIYLNISTKIIIICLIHKEFKQTPGSHLQGNGCPRCQKNYILNTEKFIERAKNIHNNKYTYNKVNYINDATKIIITCPNHDDFEQTPNSHLQGRGCSKCGFSISKPEIAWLNSLNISEEYRHKTFFINKKKFNVDAFDPTTKTIYEFYGDYWHGNPKKFNPNDINLKNNLLFKNLYQETIEREILIKNAGYNLITIWEFDFKKSLKQNHM